MRTCSTPTCVRPHHANADPGPSSNVIRRLRAGEKIPTAAPRRYRTDAGYVNLRWKVGRRQYVEVTEHRVVDGVVTSAEQVHHVNEVKDDNRPENLVPVGRRTHGVHHRLFGPEQEEFIVGMYQAGCVGPDIAAAVGCETGTIYKTLKRLGARAREANRSRHLPDRPTAAAYLAAHSAEAQAVGLPLSPQFRLDNESENA